MGHHSRRARQWIARVDLSVYACALTEISGERTRLRVLVSAPRRNILLVAVEADSRVHSKKFATATARSPTRGADATPPVLNARTPFGKLQSTPRSWSEKRLVRSRELRWARRRPFA